MTIKIGEFEVIKTQTLLVTDSYETWLEEELLGWNIKIKIELEEDKSKPNEGRFNIEGVDDYGLLTLTNWQSPLGMSFPEPVEFGTTNNAKIYFQIFGHKVGTVTKLDIQFYKECQDGK